MADANATTDRYVKHPTTASQIELLLRQPGGALSASEREAWCIMAHQQDRIIASVNRATRQLEEFGRVRRFLLWVGSAVVLGALAFLGKVGVAVLEFYFKAKP